MNRYRLKKIAIKNFKIFSDVFECNFEGNDLIVLDGPNGFGKTSIFDAVELGLTGVIKRLDLYDDSIKNKQKLHGFPFVNNLASDFYIKLELVSENGTLIVCRYLPLSDIKDRDRGKIKWEKIKIGRLENWDDPIDSCSSLSQSELESLLGTPDLQRIFNLFFYVQQEENTFFLKRSENDRKEYLNVLFDVESENKVLEKIKKLLKFHKDYNNLLIEEVKKIESSQFKINSIDEFDNVMFKKLFHSGAHEWDVERPDFNKISFANLESGLVNVGNLLIHLVEFKQQSYALKIRSYLSSPNFISSFVLLEFFESSFDKIEKRIVQVNFLKKIILELSTDHRYSLDFWISIKDELMSLEIKNEQLILNKLNEYLELKKSANSIESTRLELGKLRSMLSDKFKVFSQLTNNENIESCPLCGSEWENLQELIIAINLQEGRFASFQQSGLKLLSDDFDTLVSDLKNKLIFINENEYQPSENLLAIMRTAKRSKELFSLFKNYLIDNKIDITSFKLVGSLDDLRLLDFVSGEIQKQVELVIESHMFFTPELFASLEACIINFFNGDLILASNVSAEEVQFKLKYLRKMHFDFMKNKNSEALLKIESHKSQLKLVEEKVLKVKSIQKIYEDKIRSHISRIINDISIPFYVNSGRILQEFHGGSGIFVKMGSLKTDGVQFYSNIDRENDPLYSLSSGQISSLVLAFCLTLNDVYRDHYLGMILIDDPIQTMDEINTITFIDLIRTNFKDRQFILSTHEDSFSSLVRYKFKQSNSNVSVIRMKDKL